MKITKFSEMVARYEQGKRQVDIAQIKEVLKVVNNITYGGLYKLIRAL